MRAKIRVNVSKIKFSNTQTPSDSHLKGKAYEMTIKAQDDFTKTEIEWFSSTASYPFVIG